MLDCLQHWNYLYWFRRISARWDTVLVVVNFLKFCICRPYHIKMKTFFIRARAMNNVSVKFNSIVTSNNNEYWNYYYWKNVTLHINVSSASHWISQWEWYFTKCIRRITIKCVVCIVTMEWTKIAQKSYKYFQHLSRIYSQQVVPVNKLHGCEKIWTFKYFVFVFVFKYCERKDADYAECWSLVLSIP